MGSQLEMVEGKCRQLQGHHLFVPQSHARKAWVVGEEVAALQNKCRRPCNGCKRLRTRMAPKCPQIRLHYRSPGREEVQLMR